MNRGIPFLILAILSNAMANILIKVGMSRVEKTGFLQTLVRAVKQPALWAGIVLFGIALAAYSLVLTRLNLSVAYPVMISAGLVIVAVVSAFILGERITAVQVLGFFLIIGGVWLVAR